jgi:hypothetical protein
MLTQYTYVFAIGTFFALLEAYNNGASMLLHPYFDRLLRQLTLSHRRCCQRLGHQCLLPLRHLPASHGPLFDL